MSEFGNYIKELRLAKKAEDKNYSIRAVARNTKVSHVFLSQLESGTHPSLPSEEIICRLAKELGGSSIKMMALAGRIPERLKQIIIRRPKLFEDLLLELENAPDDAIVRIVRVIRDGDW